MIVQTKFPFENDNGSSGKVFTIILLTLIAGTAIYLGYQYISSTVDEEMIQKWSYPLFFDLPHPKVAKVNNKICLVNEEGTYSAYNGLREKVGKLSSKTKCNTTLSNFLNNSIVNGRVWAIF